MSVTRFSYNLLFIPPRILGISQIERCDVHRAAPDTLDIVCQTQPEELETNLRQEDIKSSAKRWSPGLMNFVPAVVYHFCLALPAAFTQPGDHPLPDPCTLSGRLQGTFAWNGEGEKFMESISGRPLTGI